MSEHLPTYGEPGADELPLLAPMMAQAFCLPEERFAEWVGKMGPASLRVVRRDGELAAGLGIYEMGQFFGGRRVPAGGVAAVVVQPHLRAAGLGCELMRACLEELRRRGLAVSPLYPATRTLYRRVGWELAGTRASYAAAPAHLGASTTPGLRLRPTRADDTGRLRELYTRAAQNTDGHLDRHEVTWGAVMHVPEGQALYGHLAEDAHTGAPEGYVLYTQAREPGSDKFIVTVKDLVFVTPGAGRRLLGLLAAHSSVAREVRIWGGPAGALHLLTGEEVLVPRERSDWMLRIVSVRAALEARGFSPAVRARIAVEVVDDVLQANSRALVLEIADGRCAVSEARAAALSIDVRGLAALYTGWASPAELRRAGYLRGPEAQDALLAGAFAGPVPWMPDCF